MSGVTEQWDEQLEQKVASEYDEVCREYRLKLNQYVRQRNGEQSREWWSEYNRYLRSSVWQVKRELVMERAGGVCECCLQRDAEHVHHLKYPDTFGMEPAWELRAVCIPCHENFHPHMRQ